MNHPSLSSIGSVTDFIAALRSLKVWAGNPSFEELRRRSGLASSTLSDALSPRRSSLPSLQTVRGFVRACGGSADDVARFEAAWRSVQARQSHAAPPLTPAATGQVPTRAAAPPRLIPRAAMPFAGREHLLDRLDALHRESAADRWSALLLLVGPAGSGKSALAAHWAHRVAHHYPDGQLYVDLHGSSPPIERGQDALAQLLRALGVPEPELPPDFRGRFGLYRSLTFSRRLLVILDDAYDAGHAAVLLPTGRRCLTIVTSRDRLSSLVASDGGHRLTVGPLAPEAAERVIVAEIGRERAAREPAAVRELVAACGGLPLALRVAAVGLADHPHWTIEEFVARREWLAATDAVLEGSLRALADPARRLLQAIAAAGQSAFTACDAGAWSDQPPEAAHRLLDALAAVHLIEPAGLDRYTMNVIVREHLCGGHAMLAG